MSKSFCVSVSALAALLLAFNLQADTLYITKDDAKGYSSFEKWNVSGGGAQAPSSGNDYVCADGKTIRNKGSGTPQKFPGKTLRFGDLSTGKAGWLAYVRSGDTEINFPNGGAILEKGGFLTYTDKGVKYKLSGTFTVNSPSSDPYVFYVLYDNEDKHRSMTNEVTGAFAGAAGTGLAILNKYSNPNGYVYLNPNNNCAFQGQFILGDGNQPLRCELQGTKTLSCGLWAKSYAEILVPNGSTKWTLASLRLDGNSTMLTKLAGNDTSTITLTDSLSTTYPVNLTFPSARETNTGTGFVWDVLTLPKEKKDMIHPEHFVLATQEAVGMFPDVFPSVELHVTEKNDLAVLELVQRQVVQNSVADDAGYGYSNQSFEFPTSMTNAMAWANKNLPMPTIDYVAANNLNAAPPSQCTDGVYEFPGASLSVKNGATFCEAAHEFTISVLRLESNARFWPLGEQYDDATAIVKGRIHMLPPTTSDYALLRVRRRSTVDIEAELTGTGNLQVQPNANDSTDSVAVFNHDNSAFLGKIRIQSNTYTNDMFTKGQTLVLKQANNVGGPLDAFMADALEVRYFSTLEVTNDVVFATANRGLTVNNARIKVGAGATFTFNNDITYAGPLVKAGAGRLVLGGSALGSKKTLMVAEGTLAVSKDAALDGVAVTFAGGALAVNPATAGEYGVKGPFSGNLPVVFDLPEDEETHDYSGIAVCTVDASADVTPTVVRIPRHRVVFTWRENGDNTKTLLADIGRTGVTIILR